MYTRPQGGRDPAACCWAVLRWECQEQSSPKEGAGRDPEVLSRCLRWDENLKGRSKGICTEKDTCRRQRWTFLTCMD